MSESPGVSAIDPERWQRWRFEVDVHWPVHGVVDSYTYHRTRRAFEADRCRDIALQAVGLRTARFTDRRIAHDPAGVLDDVRNLLVDSARGRSP